MIKYSFLIFLFALQACTNNSAQQPIIKKLDTKVEVASPIIVDTLAYKKMIASWKNKPSTDNQKYHFIVDSIMPNWYGTEWNFYGTTTVPTQGTIACGYFVTTLVQHANIPVARVKLAQQVSSKIITTLCHAKSIGRFANFNFFKKYFDAYPNESLFIVGLDCHTGFIIKEDNKLYFIHSSYVSPAVVKKEDLFTAIPITSSKNWWVGKLL